MKPQRFLHTSHVGLSLLIWIATFSTLSVFAKKNFEREATREFYESRVNDRTLSIDRRLQFLDSLISEGSKAEQTSLMIRRADMLADGCRYKEAYHQYDLALRELPKDSLRKRMLLILKMSKNAYYGNRYRESLRNIVELLRTEKPDSLLWIDIDAINILMAMDNLRGRFDLMQIYLKNLDECYSRLKKSKATPEVISRAHSRIIISHAICESDPKKIFELYMQAKKTETDSARIDGMNNNIGVVHFKLKEYEKARHYFETVLRSHRPGTARVFAVVNYINSFIKENDGAGADSAMKKYEHILQELDGTPMEWERYKLIYNVLYLNGRKLEALPYLERTVELLDSLNAPENELMFADTSTEVSELLAERKYGPHIINSRKKTIGILLLCGVLLLTAVALWFFHRKARKKESEVGAMASRLDETISRHREEREEIDQSIQMRGQELSALKMRNEILRKAIDTIVADVNRLQSPRSELARRINDTVKNLSNAENAFNARSITLENVNQAFFDKLYTEHPELTNAERDMCAYALMGLQPKEIATLTNRSVKTVNCIRHNVRKKLGISATESTEAYMRMLSAGLKTEEEPGRTEAENN